MVHLFNVPPSSCADSNARRNLRRKGRVITGLIASLLVGALATAAASCADGADGRRDARASAPGSDTTSPASVAAQAPHVSAPLDLAGVMKRVHFSFRRDDSGAFSGGHTSYEVRTSAGGISVTPGRTDVDRDPKTNTLPAEAIGAPVNFETVALGRGAALHDAPLGEPRVAEAGHLILPRGEFEEQFENTEDGVEQRFAFAKRPEGRGDLVIRVRVSGEEYAGETEWGHHFVDSSTGIGLRYGLATWIDATGERTALRVDYRYDAGALELTVPEDVLEGSAYPAVLDPYISPEMGTDNPILGLVNQEQMDSDVAFDGTNYTVVWLDRRVLNNDIYVAQVSPSGTLLTPGGIPIVYGVVNDVPPAIGFGGTNYLVAWSGVANGDFVIFSALLSQSATLLTAPMQLNTIDYSFRPSIAFDGTNYLVVFEEASSKVQGVRVNTAGNPVGSKITISQGSGERAAATVAFDGTNYFVAWQDERNNTAGDIYGARVTPTGIVLDPTGIAISTAVNGQLNPDIAFDGTNYLVVWDDAKWGGARDIYGSFITPAGVVMNPTGFEISKSLGDEKTPGIAFDGQRYIVAWGDTRNGNSNVYAARVLPGGVVLDPTGIQVTSNAVTAKDLSMACGGASCLMVFVDQRPPSSSLFSTDIWGARINGAGTVLDPDGFPITVSANEQINPVVVRGNGQYLAVWQDHRSFSTWDIYGTRIDFSGNAVDLNGIPISTAVGDQLEPDVTWNGTNWFVAWEDRRNATTGDIYGARVDATGTVLDPSGIAISAKANMERHAAVSFDGTNHLVVWNDLRSGGGDVYGARVTSAGTVLDVNGILLGQTANNDMYPEVAFDGTNYFVAWQQQGNDQARGRRVTPSGTLLDTLGGLVIGPADDWRPIDVVYDGLNFFVVMPQWNGSFYAVYGSRVSSAGTALDPGGFVIATLNSSGGPPEPGITRDGQGVFVLWRSPNPSYYESMIRGTWISQAGDFSHLGGFIVSDIPNSNHSRPVAAADNAGNVLVAYQRHTMGGIATGHERTYVRLISTLANGMACSDNAACLSGFCVDGVCCNSACGGNPDDCLGCSVAVGAGVDGTCSALNAVPCSDGNGCTTGDTCMTGVCMSGGPNPCSAPDDCHLDGTCNTMTGICTNPVKANGSTCDDGNGCTQADSCQTGVCVGANPVVCPQDTQCNIVSACDPMTGACPVANEPDGMACDDGNECSQSSVCQNGVCLGSNYTVCPPPDQCHLPGMCEPSLGTCSYNPKPNGSACNDDNACTLTDTCQAGTCVGVNSPCPATTDCAIVSPCDPGTGTCTVTNEPDGKACSDGNACTQMDTCLAGQCAGGSPVVCPPPAQCKQPGVCDAGAGQCVYPNEINGVACDDGNACTMVDFCVAGACTSGTPIVCAPLDDCHDAGSCDAATGICSNPVKPDGAACPGGVCMAGICGLAPDGGQSSSSSSSGGGSGGQSSSSSGTGGGASSSSGAGGKGGGGASSSSGAGGASGEGGSGASGEGGSGTSGGTAPADPGDCGCRTVHTKSNVTPIAALGAVTLLLSRRRRRTRVN